MKPAPVQKTPTDRFVPLRQLAREFGTSRADLCRWLLRHDFNVDRRVAVVDAPGADPMAVLTAREAAQARFLQRHGVVFQRITD